MVTACGNQRWSGFLLILALVTLTHPSRLPVVSKWARQALLLLRTTCVLPAKHRFFAASDAGFEPATPPCKGGETDFRALHGSAYSPCSSGFSFYGLQAIAGDCGRVRVNRGRSDGRDDQGSTRCRQALHKNSRRISKFLFTCKSRLFPVSETPLLQCTHVHNLHLSRLLVA